MTWIAQFELVYYCRHRVVCRHSTRISTFGFRRSNFQLTFYEHDLKKPSCCTFDIYFIVTSKCGLSVHSFGNSVWDLFVGVLCGIANSFSILLEY